MKQSADLLKIFSSFFRIGLFTIGGGLAMIPIMRNEFIDKHRWIDDKDITDIFALSQSMPGAIAINAATMIGYRLAGFTGAFVATLGTVLPSFMVIFIIASLFTDAMGENMYVRKVFSGINGGITALILVATIKMAKTAVVDNFGRLLAAAGFAAMLFLSVDIAVLVVLAAVVGYIYYRQKSGVL